MSTPACSKFFSVPELVEQLGPFLRPHDLAQLLRTSRSLYAATVLHFWRHVDLEDDHRVDQLITSPAALDALVKNAPFIHSLKAGFIFVSYYFEGVTRFLDEQEQEDEEDESTPRLLITSNTRIKRPPWLPKPVTQTPQARSLPPMTRLTQLDICFDRRYRGVQFDNAMRIHSAVSMHLPLAWLMTLNTTGLARVTFRHIQYTLQPLELRCLARSLSKLTNLTHFKTEMSAGSISELWLTPPMVPLLFFAFPTSVVSIKMEAHVRSWFDGDAEELELRTVQRAAAEQLDEGEGQRSRTPSLDWAEGDLMTREEPLENLKELELPTSSARYSGHDLSRIMKHCPALEAWYIPRFDDDVGAEALCRTIRETVHQQHGQGQASRYLRHLRSNRRRLIPNFYHGEGWVRVLNSLPDQHVESVDFDQYLDSYPDKFIPALLRHSEVLRSVVLKNSHRIGSRTVATILVQCHGLETFRATMPKEDAGRGFVALALNDAIERAWVCTRIKSLRFTVDLAVQEYSGSGTAGRSGGGGGGGSSGRAADMSSFLNVKQPPKEYWTKLEVFYSQLGKLVELEDLEIFVAPPPMRTTENVVPVFMNTASHSLRSLTGLLSLEEEDKETGKRGFLSLLGGLKKLRVVQGCFRTGTVETIGTFGEREAEWILENWPALEAIEFLPEWYGSLEGFSMPKPLKGLHEKKPDLKLSL
ncbi:hypothetical protein KI688_002980 [Linnemannia hyalina]|uniref:Uncharacterized protein n=1 Tax=Linnemannia hyalina TaxID=64524 RepID=A0A9P8BR76_9FUNG|nr:hypothetical protein KI688_002980 [Linnemannia hyalina]